MKKPKSLILIVVFLIALFVPVIPVNVVPEWELRLIDESGQPVPNVRVEQWWKDYSLEFWRWPHSEESMPSNEEGVIRLPARNILVSISQIIAAKIVDVLTSISPHASYGPHSFLVCQGSVNCSARYQPGEDMPKVIVVEK
jgi:hypothetical protein